MPHDHYFWEKRCKLLKTLKKVVVKSVVDVHYLTTTFTKTKKMR